VPGPHPPEDILGEPFRPPFPLKSARIQTLLASMRLRAAGPNPMAAAARQMILRTEGGVRLLGALSRQPSGRAKSLVILIHGWEGSMASTYMLTAGKRFYRSGHDVFRLNLRDHGASHHLNPGLFFATRIEEVFAGVRRAARLSRGRPVFLVGFSLGGNFVLRIARRCAVKPIPRLSHVFSVSPVLDPDKSTDRIEDEPLILAYFMRKWTGSLRRKAALFPERYDMERALARRTLRGITERLVADHSPFADARAYFAAYALKGDALAGVTVPTTIVTAEDDPIIPVADFHRLTLSPSIRLVVHRRGGHQGFVETLSMGCWHERKMAALFGAVAEQ
jgi:predicted alpha/beta-fold hydrolase